MIKALRIKIKGFANTLAIRYSNIKTMFKAILDCYARLNNNRAKHSGQNSQPFKDYEVEFLFYLVGNFMRFFMKINQEEIKDAKH